MLNMRTPTWRENYSQFAGTPRAAAPVELPTELHAELHAVADHNDTPRTHATHATSPLSAPCVHLPPLTSFWAAHRKLQRPSCRPRGAGHHQRDLQTPPGTRARGGRQAASPAVVGGAADMTSLGAGLLLLLVLSSGHLSDSAATTAALDVAPGSSGGGDSSATARPPPAAAAAHHHPSLLPNGSIHGDVILGVCSGAGAAGCGGSGGSSCRGSPHANGSSAAESAQDGAAGATAPQVLTLCMQPGTQIIRSWLLAPSGTCRRRKCCTKGQRGLRTVLGHIHTRTPGIGSCGGALCQ